jgi:hypothetical protein
LQDAFTYLLGITRENDEPIFKKNRPGRPIVPWFTERNDSVMISAFIVLPI